MALGLPTLLLSGSLMNGYAASLFSNLWATSPAFRAEFTRDEQRLFEDRYGYRKRVCTDTSGGEVIEFGSCPIVLYAARATPEPPREYCRC